MEYDIKIIPTPEFKNKILNKKPRNNQITEMIEEILNTELKKGWEFNDIKTITVPIKSTFFKSSSEKNVSIMIFKKYKNDNSKSDNSTFSTKDENYPSLGPAVKD